MNLENIVITNIEVPVLVHSEKGRKCNIVKRAFYGISFCLGGQIAYTKNGKKYVSTEDNAVILPFKQSYSLTGDKEGIFPLINFNCIGFDCDDIVVIPIKNAGEFINKFNSLKKSFGQKNGRLKAYSILYDIINMLLFEMSNEHNSLADVEKYIEKNLSENRLSNEDLAKYMGISEVYLRKLFARNLGVSPRQYIIESRIKKAKQLLIDTNLTVTEISEKCGFTSLYHFCRAFKERTGITPGEFAKQNKIYLL
ncbi:MAG: helix-turn-helix transcriptional regulator [Ruminococcaceae bacterium]|nr:helix-turn-helix transcriptional regulator [Oscillospiraceae bacterium]